MAGSVTAGVTTPMARLVKAAGTTASVIFLLPMLFHPECVSIGIRVLQEDP